MVPYVFTVQKGNFDPDEFQLEIIDAGVEECELEADAFFITCPMEVFGSVQKKLEQMGAKIENAQLQRIPNDTKKIDVESSQKVLKMVEEFEELDDVQNVYHNLEMSEELMMAMENE